MIDYKNAEKKPAPRQINYSTIAKIVLFVLVLILLSFGIYFSIYTYKIYTKKFYVLKHIYIEDNKILNRNYIIKNVMNINSARSLYLYNTQNIYSKLISNAWVQTAEIAKFYPDTIYIRIKERIPAGILYKQKKKFIIDDKGSIISNYGSNIYISTKLDNLPKIKINKNYKQNDLSNILNLSLKRFEKMDKIGKIDYIEVVSDSYELFHFKNGLIVAINALRCNAGAYNRLEREWSEFVSRKDKIEFISICYHDKIVIKWERGVSGE